MRSLRHSSLLYFSSTSLCARSHSVGLSSPGTNSACRAALNPARNASATSSHVAPGTKACNGVVFSRYRAKASSLAVSLGKRSMAKNSAERSSTGNDPCCSNASSFQTCALPISLKPPLVRSAWVEEAKQAAEGCLLTRSSLSSACTPRIASAAATPGQDRHKRPPLLAGRRSACR